jgi:hypothetical protein
MRARTLLVAAAAAALALASPALAADGVTVSVDRTAVKAALGHAFVVRSTIANHGATPATGLIAHLNVLSLRGDVYVDPEDWSSSRTRYLVPIPAGGSTTLTWKLDAVSPGHLGVYIAALSRAGTTAPTVSRTVSVTVADRRTLNAGGILPLALGIPALLALVTLFLRLGRTRARRLGSGVGTLGS